jgi:DNA-binding NtrC family response regulator
MRDAATTWLSPPTDEPPPISALLSMDTALPFKAAKARLLEAFERIYVHSLARRQPVNLSAASRETGLSRRHLRHLLRKHSLYRTQGVEP